MKDEGQLEMWYFRKHIYIDFSQAVYQGLLRRTFKFKFYSHLRLIDWYKLHKIGYIYADLSQSIKVTVTYTV